MLRMRWDFEKEQYTEKYFLAVFSGQELQLYQNMSL